MKNYPQPVYRLTGKITEVSVAYTGNEKFSTGRYLDGKIAVQIRNSPFGLIRRIKNRCPYDRFSIDIDESGRNSYMPPPERSMSPVRT